MGGELLLYRLLAAYPPERLRVVASDWTASGGPEARLPGVDYRSLSYPRPRWICNKYNPFWPAIVRQWVRLYTARAGRLVVDFRPEAVLTVSHGFLWLTADAIARQFRVPLHLIAHDDWPTQMTGFRDSWLRRGVRRYCEGRFRRVFQSAQETYCVSPNMLDDYERLFRRRGRLLYPNRGEDSPQPRLRARARSAERGPVVAFAGSPNIEGVRDLLREAAAVLAEFGGFLDIYSQYSTEGLAAIRLTGPAIRAQGFLPPTELAERIASAADLLLLPSSFRDNEQLGVRRLFPSKLADYTAIGMPILIWAPPDSSAGRWGRENPDAAVTVTDRNANRFREAVVRLTDDPEFAAQVATAGIAAGNRDFSLSAAREKFYKGLIGGKPIPVPESATLPQESSS